jgi:hypothetical protein
MGLGRGDALFTAERFNYLIAGACKKIPHDPPVVFLIFNN